MIRCLAPIRRKDHPAWQTQLCPDRNWTSRCSQAAGRVDRSVIYWIHPPGKRCAVTTDSASDVQMSGMRVLRHVTDRRREADLSVVILRTHSNDFVIVERTATQK
jgi:hypothetical protein